MSVRVLLVGFAGSIHLARYAALLADLDWEIHLFDSFGKSPLHEDFRQLQAHVADDVLVSAPHPSVRVSGIELTDGDWAASQARALATVIDDLRPDVIHSHELQHGGYLALAAREHLGGWFPPWLVTNWGSDISLFGQFPQHARWIRSAMAACDYYAAECVRDIAYARAFGFRGQVIGIWPVAGGFDLDDAASLRAPGPVSGRRAVMLKGNGGFFGRGLAGLEAIERCADLLGDYELLLHSASREVQERGESLERERGIAVRLISGDTQLARHRQILAAHGRARTSITLNISDGLSTSFQEAALMGSFPIQAESSCAAELSGRALFVPPDRPELIAEALRRVLTDDELVDRAAELNAEMAANQLDRRIVRARVLDGYERILADTRVRSAA
jgi:hypothetical protein